MADNFARYRVEILRDNHGPYGIGVAGFTENPGDAPGAASPIIFQPEHFFSAGFYTRPAYQQIMLGGAFKHTAENALRQIIHWGMLDRAGLSIQEGGIGGKPEWWSKDKAKQDENRRTFHGLKLCSVKVLTRIAQITL